MKDKEVKETPNFPQYVFEQDNIPDSMDEEKLRTKSVKKTKAYGKTFDGKRIRYKIKDIRSDSSQADLLRQAIDDLDSLKKLASKLPDRMNMSILRKIIRIKETLSYVGTAR